MDKQIKIWDTKIPDKKPWKTSQWTLDFYEGKWPGRFKKFSDAIPEPIPVEEIGRTVRVPDAPTIPKHEDVQAAKEKHPAAKVHKGNLNKSQVSANVKKKRKK